MEQLRYNVAEPNSTFDFDNGIIPYIVQHWYGGGALFYQILRPLDGGGRTML